MGWVKNRPLHVVVADNEVDRETIIITVYEPDKEQWESDFEHRRLP